MKTFRELEEVVKDWDDIPMTEFCEKYNIVSGSFSQAFGFVQGVCFSLEREVPDDDD